MQMGQGIEKASCLLYPRIIGGLLQFIQHTNGTGDA